MYYNFGADLSLKDLGYVFALANSAKRDCDAANASNLTVGIWALINDKLAMCQEALTLVEGTQIAKADAKTYQTAVDAFIAANVKYQELVKLTPIADAAPFTPPPYSAYAVFCAPPEPPSTLVLKTVAQNTYKPATISLEEQYKGTEAYRAMLRNKALKAQSTTKAFDIKTVGIIAAAAAAAFFMLKG
jgi:hypothetical protein